MYIKIKSILIIFFLFTLKTYSQDLLLGFELGYQNYKMEQLKYFSSDIERKLDFDVKTVTNYPPFYNYGGIIALSLDNKTEFGYRMNFASTGARISSKDYSGEYWLNGIIKRNSHGVFVAIPLNKKSRLTTQIFFEGGHIWSNLTITEKYEIYEFVNQSIEDEFKSTAYYTTPAFAIRYSIKPFLIRLKIGYEIDFFVSSLEYTEDSNFIFPKTKGVETKPNWSGVFINFGLVLNTNQLIPLLKE